MMPFFEIEKVEVKKPKVKHDCSTCPLDKSTQIEVEGLGEKNILILTSKVLTNEQSRWIERQLNDNNLYSEDCWFSSVAQCEHKGEASNKVINSCRQQWKAQIKELKPKKILLFGHTALKAFVGDRMNDIGKMERWVGWAIPDQDYKCWVFPLFDIDFVKGHKNEAVEYVFQDHLVNALDHNEEFKEHFETVNVITDVKEAIDYLQYELLESFPEELSFDYEGTGLKPYREEQELTSVSFATDKYDATSFPLFDDDTFHDELKQVLANKSIKKTAHNIVFEQKWTRHVLGFEVENFVFDPMLACHILDNRTGIGKLKFQAYIKYGVPGYGDSIKPFLEGTREGEDEKSDNRLNNIHLAPADKLLYYGGQDAMFERRLSIDCMKEIKERNLTKQYNFFFDGVLALANITENGMRIDEDYYKKQYDFLTNKLTELEQKIYTSKEGLEWRRIKGKDLEISKDAQTKSLVLDVLKLKITKQTKGSTKENPTYSVDKEVLKGLAKKHEILNDIIAWRETFKIRGTYVDGFLRESINGIIHPNQNLHTTKTYRPSTTAPNFANIPKRDKEAQKLVRTGVIPRKDHLLLTVDFDGIEVCSGCFYHKDPVMIDYVTNPDNDMHRDQALRLFLLHPSQITSEIRYVGKNGFVFPEFYGDYWRSCAKAMWDAIDKLYTHNEYDYLLKDHLRDQGIKNYKDFEEHVKEEERVFWKEKFKVFDGWKAEAWEKYLSLGYVEYLTGFRCGGVLDRKNVVNYPFQGTAFHLLLWSLINLDKELSIVTQGWDSYVCLQVYDEMMFDVHPDELDELVPLIRETMTEKVRKHWDWINVPLSVEIKTSEINGNWFEMKELK